MSAPVRAVRTEAARRIALGTTTRANAQARRHPQAQAERARDQSARGFAEAPSAHLLLQLSWPRGPVEAGEGRPQGTSDRILGQQPAELVGGHGDEGEIGQPDLPRQGFAAVAKEGPRPLTADR